MLVAGELCCFGGAETLRRRCKCVFGKQVSQVGDFGGVEFHRAFYQNGSNLQVPQHQGFLAAVPG